MLTVLQVHVSLDSKSHIKSVEVKKLSKKKCQWSSKYGWAITNRKLLNINVARCIRPSKQTWRSIFISTFVAFVVFFFIIFISARGKIFSTFVSISRSKSWCYCLCRRGWISAMSLTEKPANTSSSLEENGLSLKNSTEAMLKMKMSLSKILDLFCVAIRDHTHQAI